MKSLALGLALTLLTSIAQAQLAPPTPLPQRHSSAPVDAPRPEEMRRILGREPNEAELQSHHHYKTKDGHEVHSPARSTHDQVPAGASAKCRDGTYSFSQHRRGTCSHHSGVREWL